MTGRASEPVGAERPDDGERRDVEVRLEEYERLPKVPEWDKGRLIALVLIIALAVSLVTAYFVGLGQSGMEFYGAAAGAFLTVAGVVPAIVGIILVDRPTTKIDGGWVVWFGAPQALSIGLVAVWFVGGFSSMLALASGEAPGPPQGYAVAVVIVAIMITAAIPLDMLLIVRRLGAKDSTRVAVSRVLRPRRSLVHRSADPGKTAGEIIKDLRDAAMLEAKRGDRRAVRERMVGLAHIARSSPEQEVLAVEELGFLGGALVHDRDQALDAVAMLSRIRPVMHPKGQGQAVHELQSIWGRALERKGSRRVGDACAQALLDYFADGPENGGELRIEAITAVVDTAIRTDRLSEAQPSLRLVVGDQTSGLPTWVTTALLDDAPASPRRAPSLAAADRPVTLLDGGRWAAHGTQEQDSGSTVG